MNLRASESVIKYTSSCQIDNFTLYGNAERNCIRHFIALFYEQYVIFVCVDGFCRQIPSRHNFMGSKNELIIPLECTIVKLTILNNPIRVGINSSDEGDFLS